MPDKTQSKPPPVQRGVSAVSQRPGVKRGVSNVSGSSRPRDLQRALSRLSSRSSAKGDGQSELQWQQSVKPKPSLFRQILNVFGHLSLIIFIALYTALGGYFFVRLEHPNEVQVNNDALIKTAILENHSCERVWKYTKDHLINYKFRNLEDERRTKHSICLVVKEELGKYADHVYSSSDMGVSNISTSNTIPKYSWNYASAMFFSATIITTIGYGNIAPATTNGRVFCIIYALIGIPLTLIAVSDMGKLFARFVVYVYKKLKKAMQGKIKDKEGKTVEVSAAVRRTLLSLKALGAMAALLIYIGSGALVFIMWENWTLFESFYFCFITMTTIGLGDVVPEHQLFMLLCTAYILIGLALTSTCIELARSEYEKSWQRMVEASKRLQGLSGVNLAETLKRLGDQIELHGEIIDLDLLKDLKHAVGGVFREDEEYEEDEEDKPTPPLIMYETTV